MLSDKHWYEIRLNKEDLCIELTSDDVYFISKQMDKWCRSLLTHEYQPPIAQSTTIAPPPVVDIPVSIEETVVAPQEPQQTVMADIQLPFTTPEPTPPTPPVIPPIVEELSPPALEPEPEITLPEPAVLSEPSPTAEVDPPDLADGIPMEPQRLPEPGPLPEPVVEPPLSEVLSAPTEPEIFPEPIPAQEPELEFEPQEPELEIPTDEAPAQVLAPEPALSPEEPLSPPSSDEDFEAVLDSLMADLQQEENGGAGFLSEVSEDASPAVSPFEESFEIEAPEVPQSTELEDALDVFLPGSTPVDQVLQSAGKKQPVSLPEPDTLGKRAPSIAEDTIDPITGVATMDAPTTVAPSDTLHLIETFSDLCDKSSAQGTEDYLLLAAYFLTYFEGAEQFSLKNINSLMVRSGLPPINHGILEAALTKGYLTLIPDMTGMADVTEYSLSTKGQEFSESLL